MRLPATVLKARCQGTHVLPLPRSLSTAPSPVGQKRHLPNAANKRNVNADGKLKQIARKDYDTGLK
jgi:hypothetical protein